MSEYTEDEIDYARERVAIMMHDGGLTYEEAKREVEKMIEEKRSKVQGKRCRVKGEWCKV